MELKTLLCVELLNELCVRCLIEEAGRDVELDAPLIY